MRPAGVSFSLTGSASLRRTSPGRLTETPWRIPDHLQAQSSTKAGSRAAASDLLRASRRGAPGGGRKTGAAGVAELADAPDSKSLILPRHLPKLAEPRSRSRAQEGAPGRRRAGRVRQPVRQVGDRPCRSPGCQGFDAGRDVARRSASSPLPATSAPDGSALVYARESERPSVAGAAAWPREAWDVACRRDAGGQR
jgi:hypothetical protein